MADARSLSIQSVLYLTSAEAVLRLTQSVANSLVFAQKSDRVGAWELAVGDSSPDPMLTSAAVAEMQGLCSAAGGSFRYDFFGENLGHGGGHNRLASGGSSELLLFLNPDALLAPDTVSELTSALAEDVGVTDARQLPLEHPKEFDAATGDESWASGACMLTKRSIFEATGGFDTSTFFMYCDDVDYSWRVRLAGYRAVYAPAARVFHDKRLDAIGAYQPGDAEIYYSAEAAILLAHKYANPARVRSLIRRFRRQGAEPLVRAVNEYVRRREAGELPVPIDRTHRVAQFIGDNYSVHRF